MSNPQFSDGFIEAFRAAKHAPEKPLVTLPQVSPEEVERRMGIVSTLSQVSAAARLLGPLAWRAGIPPTITLKKDFYHNRFLRPTIAESHVFYRGWSIACSYVERDTGDSGGKMQSEGFSRLKGLSFDRSGRLFEYHLRANYAGTVVTEAISNTNVVLSTEQSIPDWVHETRYAGRHRNRAEVLLDGLAGFAVHNNIDVENLQ